MSLPFTPVIIVGAARSGTNMLRDMIAALPGFATWPCDEINPVWRHGNRVWPDDEIPAERAALGQRCIRGAFTALWRRAGGCRFIVEKTCANTLRLPFVSAVLPEAKYIQLVRDGRCVVPSAARRWRGEMEGGGMGYFFAKARFTPLGDLPHYGAEFFASRLHKMLGKSDRLRLWGPRFSGMSDLLSRPLNEICARQWLACVDRSDAALAAIGPQKWMRLRYEDIVASPAAALGEVASFLAAEADTAAIKAAVAQVAPKAGGTSRQTQIDAGISQIMNEARLRHGYKV